VQQDGRWTLAALPERLLPLPVASAIHQRLSHLDPSALDLLRVAAVIGRGFSVTVSLKESFSHVHCFHTAHANADCAPDSRRHAGRRHIGTETGGIACLKGLQGARGYPF